MPRPPLLPVASGLLLALSCPPYPSGPLPFLALTPFAVYCAGLPGGREGSLDAARGGLWLGVVFFGALLYWVAFSLPGQQLLGLSAYLGAVAVLVLAPVLAGWLLHGGIHRAGAPLWLALPLAWTASEWARAHLPGGLAFPWAGSALALAGAPRMLGLLPWVGEHGVTFWIALVNGLAGTAFLRRHGAGALVPALAAAAVAALPLALTAPAPAAGGVRVVLLQTEVSIEERRDPTAGADRMASDVDRLLASLAPGDADLVVLPETAFPVALEEPAGAPWLETVRLEAARLGAPVLVGAFGRTDGTPGRPYNSVFLVDSAGVEARYDKRRLVPAIERSPFASDALLGALGDTSSYAVGALPTPLVVGSARVGTLVCFEAAFADLARAERRAGATLLVNVTNDAWFGGGLPGRAARAQHEAHAVLRALEGRVSVVRVANGGRSALIDPAGRITPVAPLGQEGVAVLLAPPPGALPPAVRVGEWVGPAAAVLAALLMLVGRRRRSGGPLPPDGAPLSAGPAG